MENIYTLSRHPDLDEMFDFLEEKLPQANMDSLEAHLLECNACATALEEMDRAGGPTSENRAQAARFKETFLDAPAHDDDRKSPPVSSGGNWNMIFRVAAIVLLALNIGWAGWYLSGGSNANGFTPYSASADRGPETDALNDALKLYANGEYEQAIVQLKALPDTEETVELKLLYLGNSYLALNKNQEAIAPLQRLADNPDWVLFRKQAQHYLGIAYLRLGQAED